MLSCLLSLLFWLCPVRCGSGGARLSAPQQAMAQARGATSLPAAEAPQPRITGWSMGDELQPAPIPAGRTLELPASPSQVVVFFNAAKSGPAPLVFRYRLDGYDPEWTETRNTSAHYRRVPPGHYEFEVQVRAANGAWSAATATLSLTQQPFFFHTWYAMALVGAALLAIAAQLLRQRDRLLKGQMGVLLEERNRIAADCHDTLMASFAAVNWQLEGVRGELRKPLPETALALQACELVCSTVKLCQAEARRIIWDLRTPEGITDLISHGLLAAIEAHRLRHTVAIDFLTEGKEVPISPGAVHHLVCICQEAMTNVIRHADAQSIEVRVVFGDELLHMTVRDDGRGFDLSGSQVHTGHFGLAVMEERARKLGGTLHVQSTLGAGTRIHVVVRYQGEYTPLASGDHPVLPWIGV